MPNKKNFPKKKTSSSNRSRPIAVPARNYLSTHTAGVAQHLKRTLVWNYTSVINVPAAYAEPLVLMLNSPYDVDVALGGLSANGFAKYMALYSKCFTIGARVKIKIVNFSTQTLSDSHIPVLVGLTTTTFSSSLASVNAAINAGNVDYSLIGSSPDHCSLKLSLDVGKFMDVPIVINDNNLFCTSTANPNQFICAHLWTSSQGATTVCSYIAEVTMNVIFTDPIPFT